MAKKPAKKPRKTPVQARAQRTVDILLDATAQVLVAEGWGGITTNKVAARAGVSIGTLYEYFPSKEALVTAMIERLADQLVSRMVKSLDEAIATGDQGVAYSWFSAMVDALEQEAPLVRVMVTQVPFTQEIPKIRLLLRNLEEIATSRTREVAKVTGRDYAPETVFLLTTIATATVIQIATDRPPGLDRDKLVSEFVRLFSEMFLK